MSKTITVTLFLDPEELEDESLADLADVGDLLDDPGINEIEIRGMNFQRGGE
ncbi:MAG: hypothetical protein ABEK04_03450 [Candidatus Nanohalobium sp.]